MLLSTHSRLLRGRLCLLPPAPELTTAELPFLPQFGSSLKATPAPEPCRTDWGLSTNPSECVCRPWERVLKKSECKENDWPSKGPSLKPVPWGPASQWLLPVSDWKWVSTEWSPFWGMHSDCSFPWHQFRCQPAQLQHLPVTAHQPTTWLSLQLGRHKRCLASASDSHQ
jgi:hypothetical protein